MEIILRAKSVFCLLVLVLFASCEKQNEPAPSSGNESIVSDVAKKREKEEFFLAGKDSKSWVVTKYLINGNDLTTVIFGECSLDNIQTFYTNGEFIEIEGATKCNPADSSVYDWGRYRFTNNYKNLLMETKNLTIEFTISQLTPVSLKAYYMDPNYGKVEFWLKPLDKIK